MCSPTVCLERGTEGSKDSEHYRSIIVTDPTGMASLMHTNAATGTRGSDGSSASHTSLGFMTVFTVEIGAVCDPW